MAITSAVCTSFKVEILKGVHNFTATTGNTFKLALYTSSATLGATQQLIQLQTKSLILLEQLTQQQALH